MLIPLGMRAAPAGFEVLRQGAWPGVVTTQRGQAVVNKPQLQLNRPVAAFGRSSPLHKPRAASGSISRLGGGSALQRNRSQAPGPANAPGWRW